SHVYRIHSFQAPSTAALMPFSQHYANLCCRTLIVVSIQLIVRIASAEIPGYHAESSDRGRSRSTLCANQSARPFSDTSAPLWCDAALRRGRPRYKARRNLANPAPTLLPTMQELLFFGQFAPSKWLPGRVHAHRRDSQRVAVWQLQSNEHMRQQP